MNFVSLACAFANHDYFLEWTVKFASREDAQAFILYFRSLNIDNRLYIHGDNTGRKIFDVPTKDLLLHLRSIPQRTLSNKTYRDPTFFQQFLTRADQLGKTFPIRTRYVQERLTPLDHPHEYDQYTCFVLKRFEPLNNIDEFFHSDFDITLACILATVFVPHCKTITAAEFNALETVDEPVWHQILELSVVDITNNKYFRSWHFQPLSENMI